EAVEHMNALGAELYPLPVIASEAKQSIAPRMRIDGLLRRFAPRNDGKSKTPERISAPAS
ncbi:hypothetical protein ABTH33_20325, partial [Acinetobacter baumannii]